jgi:hypothetical protein
MSDAARNRGGDRIDVLVWFGACVARYRREQYYHHQLVTPQLTHAARTHGKVPQDYDRRFYSVLLRVSQINIFLCFL